MSSHCRCIRTNKTDDFTENLTPLNTAVCPVGKPLTSCHRCPKHINDMNSKISPEQQRNALGSSQGHPGFLRCPVLGHL